MSCLFTYFAYTQWYSGNQLGQQGSNNPDQLHSRKALYPLQYGADSFGFILKENSRCRGRDCPSSATQTFEGQVCIFTAKLGRSDFKHFKMFSDIHLGVKYLTTQFKVSLYFQDSKLLSRYILIGVTQCCFLFISA